MPKASYLNLKLSTQVLVTMCQLTTKASLTKYQKQENYPKFVSHQLKTQDAAYSSRLVISI